MFDIDLTYDEIPSDYKEKNITIFKRTAVRGIIFDKDKLLLVKTKHGDYKFPGGGVNKGETPEQALLREIAEETGYADVSVCCKFGHAFEQNIDWFVDNAYFQMDSYYFICKLNSDLRCDTHQEDYEKDLGYEAVKIDLKTAYYDNQKLHIKALDGRVKVDSTKWPRELDGLDREFNVMKTLIDCPCAIIIPLVYQCGQIIKNADRTSLNIDAKGGHANFVTDYDAKIQKILKSELSILFPDTAFVGEEEDIHASIENGYAFIVDPIDGTSNFMKDYHMSCISIGMTYNAKPYAAVIYNPYLEEFYYSVKDKGAFCNSQKLSVSKEKIDRAIVLFGTAPYYEEFTDVTFDLAKKYLKQAIDLRRSGSAALDLCAIAAGRAEIYFECKLCPWDFAAGALLVAEAGGIVTDMDGNELSFDRQCSILASNGVAKLENC